MPIYFPLLLLLLLGLLGGSVSIAAGARNPILHNDSIYLATDSLRRWNAVSGKVIWASLESKHPNGLVLAGDLIVTSDSVGVYAFNRNNGAPAWSASDAIQYFAPAAESGRVFVGSEQGVLRALKASNGSELWKKQFDGWVYSPAVSQNTLVVTGQSHEMLGLSAITGEVLWSRALPQEAVHRPVLLDSSTVVVTAFDGSVWAVDAESGDVIWRFKDSMPNAGAVAADDNLLLRRFDGSVQGLDAASGKLLWLNTEVDAGLEQLQIDSNLVLITDSERRVQVLSLKSGEGLWSGQSAIQPDSYATLFKGCVYVLTARKGGNATSTDSVHSFADMKLCPQ